LSVDDAFNLLRNAARGQNRRLSEVALAIVDGSEQLPPATMPAQARQGTTGVPPLS
jgi:hypothetical protein